MTEFKGRIWRIRGGCIHPVEGLYAWCGERSGKPMIFGTIYRPSSTLVYLSGRGRGWQLEIEDIGLSPVKLRTGWRNGLYQVWFDAWESPVPLIKHDEIGDVLWTAMYDALHEAGHPELAGYARAAKVMLHGWSPKPTKKAKVES